jgi:hypothetical protein
MTDKNAATEPPHEIEVVDADTGEVRTIVLIGFTDEDFEDDLLMMEILAEER